jgi:NOL1/NOP2/sun family putative RNA methylase
MTDILQDNLDNNRELYDYLRDFYGDNLSLFLNSRPEPTALRVNRLKYSSDKLRADLERYAIGYRPIDFNEDGYIVEDRHFKLSHTLGFFKGHFQYQGISSQIPAVLLAPQAGDIVLDMAAAPGSKSTQMGAMMKNRGVLYLNDFSRARLTALSTNVQRAGIYNSIILQLPGERIGNIYREKFDKILVDAPCTALGGIAESDELLSWWSRWKLNTLSARQLRLMISAFKALKIGGEVVYSTCSIAPEENEMIVQYMLDHYPLEIVELDNPRLKKFSDTVFRYKETIFSSEMKNALRIEPGRDHLEGFFVVKLRKIGAKKTLAEKADSGEVKETLSYDELRDELDSISGQWGIPNDLWKNFRYIHSRKRLWIMNSGIARIGKEGFVNAGIKLAEKRSSIWKLSNQSAQLFAQEITKRRFTLSRDDFKTLFSCGEVRSASVKNGYHALTWENDVIAVVYAENGSIRIRLPHKFNFPEMK